MATNPYINSTLVTFKADVMVVTFFSKTKISGATVNHEKNRYAYTFTYSPASGAALNGIAASAVAKEDVPFVRSLLGGANLKAVYPEMKTKYAAMQARYSGSRRSNECTCGRCFDCVAQ